MQNLGGGRPPGILSGLLPRLLKPCVIQLPQVKVHLSPLSTGVNTPNHGGTQASQDFPITLDWTVPGWPVAEMVCIVGSGDQILKQGTAGREMDVMSRAFIETMNRGDVPTGHEFSSTSQIPTTPFHYNDFD